MFELALPCSGIESCHKYDRHNDVPNVPLSNVFMSNGVYSFRSFWIPTFFIYSASYILHSYDFICLNLPQKKKTTKKTGKASTMTDRFHSSTNKNFLKLPSENRLTETFEITYQQSSGNSDTQKKYLEQPLELSKRNHQSRRKEQTYACRPREIVVSLSCRESSQGTFFIIIPGAKVRNEGYQFSDCLHTSSEQWQAATTTRRTSQRNVFFFFLVPKISYWQILKLKEFHRKRLFGEFDSRIGWCAGCKMMCSSMMAKSLSKREGG